MDKVDLYMQVTCEIDRRQRDRVSKDRLFPKGPCSVASCQHFTSEVLLPVSSAGLLPSRFDRLYRLAISTVALIQLLTRRRVSNTKAYLTHIESIFLCLRTPGACASSWIFTQLSQRLSHATMEVPMPPQVEVDSYFPENPSPCPLPVPHPTESFWLHSSPNCNPLANHGRTSPLPQQVDILIIGSGISGISTLHHLVQGLRKSSRSVTNIAVLEARQFCSGATGRNGGKARSLREAQTT